MSAKSKLKLATLFLKEVGKIVSSDTKKKIEGDLMKLEEMVNSYSNEDNLNIESEKVAYLILKDVINVCVGRLDLYFGLNKEENHDKIKEMVGDKKVLSKEELNSLIYKLIMDDEITNLNINEFLNEFGIEESSGEQ